MGRNPDHEYREYRRIKKKLRMARADQGAVIEQAQRRMSELLDNSYLVQSFKVVRAMAGVLLCIGGWTSIVYLGPLGFILSAIVVALLVSVSPRWMQRVRHSAALRLSVELQPFETIIAKGKSSLLAAENQYEWECEQYCSYPPDWHKRREVVLIRDGYRCTSCGWPDGFKRKRRELHVHHVKSLARGGTNSLENLTTLCHMCHRSVDGDHRGVHNTRQRKKAR